MPTQHLFNSRTLMEQAAPDEQFKVRLLLRQITNPRPYTKSGKGNRVYVFEWDERLGLHVLDIPYSVWIRGFSPRGTHNADSLMYELTAFPCHHLPLIPYFEPMALSEAVGGSSVDSVKLALFSDLLSRVGAPPALLEAAGRLATDTTEDFREFVSTVVVDDEPGDETSDTPSEQPAKAKGGRKSSLTPDERKKRAAEQAKVRMQNKRERERATANA